MLLLHQTGGVKVGDVVRYTVSYTPAPEAASTVPDKLHLRIRNTTSATMRAAVLIGPFTLSVCAYPTVFNPFKKLEKPRSHGVPQFEPMVKAGANWKCDLSVPDEVRHGEAGATASWVIEISSQILFTTAAVVAFDVMLASDADSLKSGMASSLSPGSHPAGKLAQHQSYMRRHSEPSVLSSSGVFSSEVTLKVEDTAMLWNSPPLAAQTGGKERQQAAESDGNESGDSGRRKGPKQKKVHLVIMTHGLHSSMGADMLFLKDSIDGAAKQARLDARERRKRRTSKGKQRDDGDESDDDDDEQVIVRGYSDNVTKTQRGIKFLGTRIAKYVLAMTYPDQPFLPSGKTADEGFPQGFAGSHRQQHHGAHQYMPHEYRDAQRRSYRVTSISFIGHSLGGLTQTYAIAYIQKHCPTFFDRIRPRNFITLAAPLLGVSNENPLYVRFALESGLVGLTGRDLGLSWGPVTAARSGWGSIVGSGPEPDTYGKPRPETKPLLRILPAGPAHAALKRFDRRTVYGNIVNDGIVPLRTSSLLFLDWQSLERVQRARREAGLIEVAAAMGWHELMGNNLVTPGQREWTPARDSMVDAVDMGKVPLPSNRDVVEGERPSALTPATALVTDAVLPSPSGFTANHPLAGFFKLFKAHAKVTLEDKLVPRKDKQMLSRGQTFNVDKPPEPAESLRGGDENFPVPPATSFLEGVGDLLNPAVADVNFLIDPDKRPKTILHDRVYEPSDIPPAPAQRQRNMLVEEEIARSYHRDMSWRKVLVKLEPDAHNNISVRRMFVNSYGWPVVQHLVEAHFSDAAVTEADRQRAKAGSRTVDDAGLLLDKETIEALRKLRQLHLRDEERSPRHTPAVEPDGVAWNETDWFDSTDDSDDNEGRNRAMRGSCRPQQPVSVSTWL